MARRLLRCALLPALLALAPPPASATTACVDFSCATACDPPPPAAVSTLIPSGAFPAGATTPIAFVDPGDHRGRWLVPTLQGAVLLWNDVAEAFAPAAFLDLRDDAGGPVLAGGERGLLALAVEPDYAATGRLYVFYTRADEGPGSEGDLVVERYTRSAADPDLADPASATRILVVEHSAAANHNGGWLAFGPDGFLYLSTGDGGGGCDGDQGTSGDGQRADSLLGKVLRLDVRGVDPGALPPDDCGIGAGAYGVPASNPFAGQEPACDEVWALGVRNPFRFSFDSASGDLWLGDVGQFQWEEINLQRAATPAPVNFGWVCREGCSTAGDSGCATPGCLPDGLMGCGYPRASGFFDPVLCHRNAGTGWQAIIGGYRYRGTHLPALAGAYLYGDAFCGQVWKTTTLDPADPAAIASACWASGFQGLYAFGEDHRGELYLVVGGQSRIDCVHGASGCFWAHGGIFDDGFESGDTLAWSSSTP